MWGGLGKKWVEMIGTGRERLQVLIRALFFRSVSDTRLKGYVGMNDVFGKYKTAMNIAEKIFIWFDGTLDI